MQETVIQGSSPRNVFIAALSAALLCLLVYLRALSCDFVNLDDPVYILNNSTIRHLDLNLLTTVFSKPYYFGWLPLTYLSFAVDYSFWGVNPLGYHLTNVLLHCSNVGLVVLIVNRLYFSRRDIGGGGYLYPGALLLVGLVWGLHPLRVESVAWVSQRKDVLNGLFTLGAVFFYLRAVQCKGTAGNEHRGRGSYWLSLGLFACSLLAKQVSVVLPVMLLLADWYPLGRIRRSSMVVILLEKLPYFALSLAVSFLTIYFASQSNVMISAADFPYYARALVSGNAIFEYCRFLLYPVGIQPYFVIGEDLPAAFTIKSVIVIVFTATCIYLGRKRPFLVVTWLCFLLPLLPVLAFTQTADDTALASRYTYLPSVVPSLAAGIFLVDRYATAAAAGRRIICFLVLPLVTLIVFGYGAMTLHLLAAWKNAGTLWTRQIEIQPLGRAYTFRGIYYFTVKNYPASLEDFTRSIRIAEQAGREDIFNLFAHRGETLRALGRHEEALQDFTTSINLSGHPQFYYFRGCSLQALGRLAEAARDFSQAGAEKGPIKWFPTRNMDRAPQ